MLSGLSRCFSFIAHVMVHKLIPKKICHMISTFKKERGQENVMPARREEGRVTTAESSRGHAERQEDSQRGTKGTGGREFVVRGHRLM